MNAATWIEGGVLICAGLLGMYDAIRLIVHRNPNSIEDLTGPGRYLLIVSLLITLSGVAYLASNRRLKPRDTNAVSRDAAAIRKVASVVIIMAAYISLIQLIGYLWATPIFFTLTLRVFDVKPWLKTLAVSAAFSVAYYVVFIGLFGMHFPKGAIFA
ncbi:MAG: tripartite tricarboxylate transporter TctB family protein [Phycisphaerales bacterium]|nr:tripartite tricarboxylate transporter TctB family protein [Phycisphaerales bacterium]